MSGTEINQSGALGLIQYRVEYGKALFLPMLIIYNADYLS